MNMSRVLMLSAFVLVSPIIASEGAGNAVEAVKVTFTQKFKDNFSYVSGSALDFCAKWTFMEKLVTRLAQPAADGTSSRIATWCQEHGVGTQRVLGAIMTSAALAGLVYAYKSAFGEDQDVDTDAEEQYFFGGDDIYDLNEEDEEAAN